VFYGKVHTAHVDAPGVHSSPRISSNVLHHTYAYGKNHVLHVRTPFSINNTPLMHLNNLHTGCGVVVQLSATYTYYMHDDFHSIHDGTFHQLILRGNVRKPSSFVYTVRRLPQYVHSCLICYCLMNACFNYIGKVYEAAHENAQRHRQPPLSRTK
jgi:hypothetical protein